MPTTDVVIPTPNVDPKLIEKEREFRHTMTNLFFKYLVASGYARVIGDCDITLQVRNHQFIKKFDVRVTGTRI